MRRSIAIALRAADTKYRKGSRPVAVLNLIAVFIRFLRVFLGLSFVLHSDKR
jgi:hypothetical protein